MHFNRRKSGGILLAIGAVALILLVASLTILLLNSNLLFNNISSKGTYKLPEGNVKGMTLSTQSENIFANISTVEEQKQFLDNFVNFAVASNLNSIFVDYLQTGGEQPTVFGRERSAGTMANISANDSFFDKFDAMEYLVSAATQKGLLVYALFDMPTSEDKIIANSAAAVMNNYAISGVFYKNIVSEGIGTLASAEGDSLSYTSPQSWTEPHELFLHTLSSSYTGMVIDDYDTAITLSDEYALMVSAVQNDTGVPTLLGYQIQPVLGVTYPTQGTTIYTDTCFVMGTSDPALPLTLDGEEVMRNTDTGAFGVLVELDSGDNTLTFEQSGNVLEYVVTRNSYSSSSSSSGSSSSSSGTTTSDNTSEVAPGTYVSVSGWIASLLYDPSSDSNINETVRSGGTAMVVNSVLTYRNYKSTWAYELSSGDYILAYNTNYIGTSMETPSFTGASAQPIDDGKGELLTFTGTGTPMAYTSVVDNTLSVRMYDTHVAPEFTVSGSEMVFSTAVNTMDDGGIEILFTFADTLFGHSIEYADGTTQLYLKKTPQISTENASKPLQGVSVLLDAGHGADDTGALGVVGVDGPSEKDANLAVMVAAKYRLEQLGATVHTIRTDDTFLSLEERNIKITELRPDFFISIHHNSVLLTVDANEAMGVECYYFYNEAESLAASLVTNIVSATGRADRGAKWGYYYVARNTICPSVLLECGFMVNPNEYEDIVSEDALWAVGDAMARSILDEVSKQ